MLSDNDKIVSAIHSVNKKLESIQSALWFIAVLLFSIFLSLAFPDWRGIFG